jgi:hypothetical protein
LWIIQHNLPGRLFPELLQLFVVVKAFQVPFQYNHHRYYTSMLHAMSEQLLTEQLAKIRQAPHYCLLVDESTDVSDNTVLLVYLRYMNVDSKRAECEFLCGVKLVSRVHSDIAAAIKAVMQVCQLNPEKIVVLTADGAMLGEKQGLLGSLRSMTGRKSLLGVHCAAHRTGLAMSDAAAEMECLQQVDAVARAVHKFFAHSSKRQQHWATYARQYGLTRLKFPVYNATRWFSRTECLEVLCENMPVLLRYLDRVQQGADRGMAAAAKELLAYVNDGNLIATLYVVADAVVRVNQMSKQLQATDLCVHHIPDIVAGCKAALLELGEDVWEHGHVAKRFHAECDAARGCWRAVRGQHTAVWLQFGPNCFDVDAVAGVAKELAAQLTTNLLERFDPELCKLLSHFTLFDPRLYLGSWSADEALGITNSKAAVKALLLHFCGSGSGIPLFEYSQQVLDSILRKELPAMQRALYEAGLNKAAVTAEGVWCGLFEGTGKKEFPHLTQLAAVMLICCGSSAVVERGFSLMKLIKTGMRNRMLPHTLDALMRVHLLGLPVGEAEAWLHQIADDVIVGHSYADRTSVAMHTTASQVVVVDPESDMYDCEQDEALFEFIMQEDAADAELVEFEEGELQLQPLVFDGEPVDADLQHLCAELDDSDAEFLAAMGCT